MKRLQIFYLGILFFLVLSNPSEAAVEDTVVTSGAQVNGIADVDDSTPTRLVKDGTETYTLNRTNTYTGGTLLNAGTLAVTAAGALGSGALTVDGSHSGTLSVGSTNIANNLVIDGTLGYSHTGTTFSGDVSGSGTWNISGANSILTGTGDYSGFSGTIAIQSGFFMVREEATDLGDATVQVKGNGFVLQAEEDFLNATKTYRVGMVTGDTIVRTSAGSKAGVICKIQVGRDTSVEDIFSGTLRDESGRQLAVEKVGSNTWRLSGSNTFTGGLTLTGGTLITTTTPGSGSITFNGGTLRTNTSFSNSILVAAGASSKLDVADAFTISGSMSGAGRLIKTGSSTVTYSGNASNFSGIWENEQGWSTFRGSTSVSSDAVYNTFSSGTSSTQAGIALIGNAGDTFQMGMLLGYGVLNPSTSSADGVLTVAVGGSGQSGTYHGTLRDQPYTNKRLAIQKTGSGTWTLTTKHTYTGGTTVDAGMLELASVAGLASDVTVGAAGTLKIAADANATIRGNLDWGGTLELEWVEGETGLLTVTGNVDFSNLTSVRLPEITLDDDVFLTFLTVADGFSMEGIPHLQAIFTESVGLDVRLVVDGNNLQITGNLAAIP